MKYFLSDEFSKPLLERLLEETCLKQAIPTNNTTEFFNYRAFIYKH